MSDESEDEGYCEGSWPESLGAQDGELHLLGVHCREEAGNHEIEGMLDVKQDKGWPFQVEVNFVEVDWDPVSSWEEQGLEVEEQGQQSEEQEAHVEEQETHVEEQGIHVESQDLPLVRQLFEQIGDDVEEDSTQSQDVVYTPPTPALSTESGLTEHGISVLESISNIEGCGVICDFLTVLDLSIDAAHVILCADEASTFFGHGEKQAGN